MIPVKNENIERKMDDMGRISVPKSLRDKYQMEPGKKYSIFTYVDESGRVYVCAQTDVYDLSEANRAAEILMKMGCEVPEKLQEVLDGAEVAQ